MDTTMRADLPSADPYAWHRAALAGEVTALDLGRVPCGFFRLRTREGAFLPVAIWEEPADTLWAKVGDRVPEALTGQEQDFSDRVLAHCWRQPITEEVYFAVCEGAPWPDVPPPREADYANLPSDPLEALRVELEGERLEAEAWLAATPITDQAAADRAANWALRFAEIEKRAGTGRRDEKIPHEQAAKAVDARWRPVQDTAAELKTKLKDAQTPFLVEKRRRETEARAEAARAGEALRPVAAAAAGTAGRKTSLRTVRSAVIEDFDSALAGLKDNPELRALVQSLADKVARAGGCLSGCRIVTTEKAA